jgi:tetratricopeptide (TPR) repeat protein
MYPTPRKILRMCLPIKMTRLIALFTLAILPASALAQSPEACVDYLPREEARDPRLLALRGVACFEARQYARALSFYRRAQRINRDPLLDAAIGRCWDELGGLDQARTFYRRFLRSAPAQDAEGRARIEERLKALEEQIEGEAARLNIEVWPTGADVWLLLPNAQRELLGKTPLQLRLRAGDYTVQVEKSGYYGRRHSVSLSSAETHTLDSALVSQRATFNVSARAWRRAGLWTMAVGAPLVVAGGVLTAVGGQTLDHARDPQLDATPERRRDLLDNGYEERAWGMGLLFFGGATVLTGSAFWLTGKLTEDDPNPAPAPTTSVAPLLAPGWAGVEVKF